MKTPIKLLPVLFALLISLTASAQTLQDAVRLSDNEQYEKSLAAFKSLVAKEPTNGDYFFYFGDLMLKMENLDSAKILFQKGVDINPTNPLTHIGMARYFFAVGDDVKGQKAITNAKSLIGTQAGKKGMNMDPPRQALMYNEIARNHLYSASPNYTEALEMINTSIKLDAKNPETYLIQGDLLFGKDPVNATPSINSYNLAAKLDPKSVKAYVRIGRLYINGKNYAAAVSFLKLSLKIDSTFAPAWREKAEAQYQAGRFDSAQQSMARYLQLNDSPHARYRQSLFLFKSGNFDEAIVQGKASLAEDSTTIIIYRIIARSYMESKTPDPAKAIETWNTFFAKQKVTGRPPLLADDYVYRAKAYSANKQDSLSVLDLNKALEMDTAKKDLYFQIATSYYILKQYDKAAINYKKKIDNVPAEVTIYDWFAYGRALQAHKNYAGADSAYIKAVLLEPANPTAWLYRAKVNVTMDPNFESDSSKVFYEKFYSLAIGDKESNKKDLVAAGKYLAAYYFIKKNFACSKAWFSFVLELDPTQSKVKEQLETDKDIKAAPVVDFNTCAPATAPEK